MTFGDSRRRILALLDRISTMNLMAGPEVANASVVVDLIRLLEREEQRALGEQWPDRITGRTVSDEIQSTYLFARPSFVEGIGRMVDVSNSLNIYNQSRTDSEADARAIYEDWKAVGHDVRVALEQLRASRE